MSKISKTAYAILGMLSIDSMSGYEIRQMIRQTTSNFWAESDGQLYPALANLVKQQFISCKPSKKTSARKKNKYSITAKGTAELQKWLIQVPDVQSVRNEVMLKLFFGANAAPEVSQEHVETHRYQAKAMLSQLIETEKELKREYTDSPHLPYWLMSIEYGIKISEAKLIWCDNVIKMLIKLKKKR